MDQLFFFDQARRDHPAVREWMLIHSDELGAVARQWFDVIRSCGEDVTELIHDGAPTACVHRAAFAYVNTYKAHVNVGFFRGADLSDPAGILQGSGRIMRHVKISPNAPVDAETLRRLIGSAYDHMKGCLVNPGKEHP